MKRRITLTSRSLRPSVRASKRILKKVNLRPKAGIIPIEYPKQAAPVTFRKGSRSVRFKGERVSIEVANQVLHYINNIEDVASLARANNLGKLVGQRILDRKKNFQEFTSLEQLKGIAGFGPLKFRDLISSSS